MCFIFTFIFIFILYVALEYAIRKVQETNLGLDMNGSHQVLAYADDVNLIGDLYQNNRKKCRGVIKCL